MDQQLKGEYEQIIKDQRSQYKALKKLYTDEKKKLNTEEERVTKINIK
jgi:hypothetical protein